MAAGKGKKQFGGVSSIGAEAIGKPGHRQFRIVLQTGLASAVLWLEKEQLQQLAVYIQEFVESLGEGGKEQCERSPDPEPTLSAEQVEFKVGKLGIGHDASSDLFLITAYDIEEDEQQEGEEKSATLTFWVTLEQAKEFASKAIKVCASGRPVCVLCGQSIGPAGHLCPKSNGHGVLEP